MAKIRRDDYGMLDQTNDYSFSGSTALAVNNRIPAYLSNQFVFGTPACRRARHRGLDH